MRRLVPTLLIALSTQSLLAQAPSRGWLLLEGGGRLRGSEVLERFIALVGGPDHHIVVIPTAISDTESAPVRIAHCEAVSSQIFRAPVTCLDARSRAAAGDPQFLAAIRAADGVWFYGGDEERLVDRYVGTPAVQALRDVLARGGIVGGTSAGAMIMATYIPARDSLPISGFDFIPRTTIAPHYSQRHYESALRAERGRRPGMRGIGIDEDTGLLVHGADAEVIGTGIVTVLDRRAFILKAGDHYDLQRDTVVVTPR